MKGKKVITILMSLILFAGAFMLMPAASATSQPVQLIYAKANSQWIYSPEEDMSLNHISVTGYVEVLNLAFEKAVTICYTNDGGETWNDVQAEYRQPTYDNYEAWEFTLPAKAVGHRSSAIFQFVIKYEVNGQTYWDTNNDDNYYLACGYGNTAKMVFGSGAFALDQANAYIIPDENTVYFTGSVQLLNIAYEKYVRVRYTTDGWATYYDLHASYFETIYSQYNQQDVERWVFSVNLPANVTQVEFAVAYAVDGITYWDNNFTLNYICPARDL